MAVVAIVVMFMANSCIDGSFDHTYYPVDDFDYPEFLKDNPDSIYNASYVYGTSNVVVYNIGSDEEKKYTGGFTVSMKCDPKFGADHQTRSPYCVADTTGAKNSPKGFAVFYQNPDPAKMPQYDMFFVGQGNCTAIETYICNSNLVANLIKYGNDEIEKFKEGDYLSVTFKTYVDDKQVGSKTIELAKYEGSLSLITDWKLVDLKDAGQYDAIDIVVNSNRNDIPLYFCLDEFTSKVVYSSSQSI